MRRCTRERVFSVQQHARIEGARVRVGAHDIQCAGSAEHHLRTCAKPVDVALNLAHLRFAGERAHPHSVNRRITDLGCREPLAQRRRDGIHHTLMHECATDCGALLTGLGRHLAHDFLHEQIEFLRARHRVGAQHRKIERVSFLIEPYRMLDDGLARAQLSRCAR